LSLGGWRMDETDGAHEADAAQPHTLDVLVALSRPVGHPTGAGLPFEHFPVLKTRETVSHIAVLLGVANITEEMEVVLRPGVLAGASAHAPLLDMRDVFPEVEPPVAGRVQDMFRLWEEEERREHGAGSLPRTMDDYTQQVVRAAAREEGALDRFKTHVLLPVPLATGRIKDWMHYVWVKRLVPTADFVAAGSVRAALAAELAVVRSLPLASLLPYVAWVDEDHSLVLDRVAVLAARELVAGASGPASTAAPTFVALRSHPWRSGAERWLRWTAQGDDSPARATIAVMSRLLGMDDSTASHVMIPVLKAGWGGGDDAGGTPAGHTGMLWSWVMVPKEFADPVPTVGALQHLLLHHNAHWDMHSYVCAGDTWFLAL